MSANRPFILLLAMLVAVVSAPVVAQDVDHVDELIADDHDHDHEHADHDHGDSHAPGETAVDDANHHEGGDHHGEYSIWSDLPFWSLIAFIGFVLAIKVLGLWNLLLTSMSTRERAEQEAITLAESHLSTAQQSLTETRGRIEALDEIVRETLAEAERDATTTRSDILNQASHEAQSAVERAEHEIERVRDQSLNQLFTAFSEKVTRLSEEKLRQGLNDNDQKRLIDQTLEQLAAN